ncbi:unnamed protein product, partial [Ilex paraguariensis]
MVIEVMPLTVAEMLNYKRPLPAIITYPSSYFMANTSTEYAELMYEESKTFTRKVAVGSLSE